MARFSNPYVAGRALAQDRGFFGRDDVFEHVASTLRSPDQNAVVLAGQRRIGKTSILLQLQRRLPSHGFVMVYFDLMDRAKKPLTRVLFEWASTIARQVGLSPPEADTFDKDGDYFRSSFLPNLYSHLPDDLRPVLLLDEFDVFDVAAEEQLPAAMAARAFFPYLRQLMATEPRLGFVFVIGRKAEDLSIQVKATFKGAHLKRVSVLDESSARELITLAQRQGSLRFSEPSVARVLDWTAGHPYLTQLLCQVIWERAHRGEVPESALPLVDVPEVDTALTQTLEQGEHVFEWIWDGLPPAERLIFAAIAEGTDGRRTVRTEDVMHLLQGHGIRILTRELELAPDLLVQWEMLSRSADGYRFPVEMLRLWVVQNKPLSRVKEELDRIVPLADSLYRSADAYYRNGKLDDALEQLRKALHANPNHLKARLRIGEILQEQGKLVAAVEELEHAFRYDEDASRYPLLRALLLRGEELERSGTQPSDLLAFYGRVLELSPSEPLALERSLALWCRLADEHEAAGRLTQALGIYQQIGLDERVQIIQAELHRREMSAEAETARAAEKRSDWRVALQYYERLLAKDPSKPWQAEIERCRLELLMALNYTEAIGALNQRLWDQAQRALVEIVAARPDYRDAAERLSDVVHRLRLSRRYPGTASKMLYIRAWVVLLCGSLLFGVGLLSGILGAKRSPTGAVVAAPTLPGVPMPAPNAGRLSAAPGEAFPNLSSRAELPPVKPKLATSQTPPADISPVSSPSAPDNDPSVKDPSVKINALAAMDSPKHKIYPAGIASLCKCKDGEDCYRNGSLQRKLSPNAALACFVKACKFSNLDGCKWSGYMNEKKAQMLLAEKFYKDACRLGDVTSCKWENPNQKKLPLIPVQVKPVRIPELL